MAKKATVKIEGAEELKRKLEALSRGARGPILERAAAEGAEIVKDAANARAPGPNIEAEVAKAAEFAVLFHIGPDKEHWYYQFAETGVSAHRIDGNVKQAIQFPGDEGLIVRFVAEHPGHAADPFLRPALEGSKAEATAAVGRALKKQIDRVVGSGG